MTISGLPSLVQIATSNVAQTTPASPTLPAIGLRIAERRALRAAPTPLDDEEPEPGVRYGVFKIDYGCYVDLLTTAKVPKGLLFPGETDEQVKHLNVPPDDYRAIRCAILEIGDV